MVSNSKLVITDGVPPPIYTLFISGENSLFRISISLINAVNHLFLDFNGGAKMKITIMTSLFAKWNMNINATHLFLHIGVFNILTKKIIIVNLL